MNDVIETTRHGGKFLVSSVCPRPGKAQRTRFALKSTCAQNFQPGLFFCRNSAATLPENAACHRIRLRVGGDLLHISAQQLTRACRPNGAEPHPKGDFHG
jgi:hypothetical protein